MPTNKPDYWSKNNGANYKKYHGTKEAIKGRILRTLARRKMEKKGLVKKGDNLEVDHINGTKAGNGAGNLRIISRLRNRQMGQKKATRSQLRNNKK